MDKPKKLLKFENQVDFTDPIAVEHFRLKGLNNALLLLINNKDKDCALAQSFQVLQEVVSCEAVYLFEIPELEEDKIKVRIHFLLDDKFPADPSVFTGNLLEVGIDKPSEQTNIKKLISRESIWGNASDLEGDPLMLLEQLGIQHFLVFPIHLDGNFWGGMLLGFRKKTKQWPKKEQQIFEPYALSLGNFIARKEAELALIGQRDKIIESRQRYQNFITYSTDGIYYVNWGKKIPITLPPEEQQAIYYKHAYLEECNQSFARMYGVEDPTQLVGQKMRDLYKMAQIGENKERIIRIYCQRLCNEKFRNGGNRPSWSGTFFS